MFSFLSLVQFGHFFGLLLLVLVFRINKKPQRAMRCSNGNIHKNPKRATKNHNEHKRHLPVLVFEIKLKLQRRAAKGNKRQMETPTKNQNEQQKATKSIFHSYFYSFAPILDLWKVVDIKRNEKPKRALTGNEKQ